MATSYYLNMTQKLISRLQESIKNTKSAQSYSMYSPTLYNNSDLRASTNDDYFKPNIQSKGIYNRNSSGWDQAFSRIPMIDPYTIPKHTTEYVFFVKPDLHLLDNGSINQELAKRSSFFSDAIDRYPHVVDQLQFSNSMSRCGGVLSPLLSNAFTGNLELPSISADQITTPQNVYGTAIEYRGSSFKSDEGFDFTIEFTDTKYLEVYMYFKMYDEYEKMKWMGQVTPTSLMYIYRKNLHDQTAIYKFIVGEDGMSIIHWSRIMGTFPTSVPRDTFSNLEGGEIKYSVSWHGQFVRDMDPIILTDFNNINKPYIGTNPKLLPLTNIQEHMFDGTLAKCPIILARNGTTQSDKLNKYYLAWVSPDGYIVPNANNINY